MSATEILPFQSWRIIDNCWRFQSSTIFLYWMNQAIVATLTYKNHPEEELCPGYEQA